MSIDIKSIIADAFLELCERKAVSRITIQDILNEAEISRGTFYNYFEDKYDLIRYCYDKKVLPQWDYMIADDIERTVNKWRLEVLCSIRKHARFMKGACLMGGQNCLREYMVEKGRRADAEWYSEQYKTELTVKLKESIYYHASACRYLIIEWILNDMPVSEERLAGILNRNVMGGKFRKNT